jgi:hypothetical protein
MTVFATLNETNTSLRVVTPMFSTVAVTEMFSPVWTVSGALFVILSLSGSSVPSTVARASRSYGGLSIGRSRVLSDPRKTQYGSYDPISESPLNCVVSVASNTETSERSIPTRSALSVRDPPFSRLSIAKFEPTKFQPGPICATPGAGGSFSNTSPKRASGLLALTYNPF